MTKKNVEIYTLEQLRLMCFDGKWKKAVIVFSYIPLPFRRRKPYNLYEMSYLVKSDTNYFSTRSSSNELMGECLDGYDICDLKMMMDEEDWKVDYCFIVPDDFEVYK